MDAGTDYSTSQVDTDTVERRLTGRSTYAETDLRKMPWRKMRRVLERKDKESEDETLGIDMMMEPSQIESGPQTTRNPTTITQPTRQTPITQGAEGTRDESRIQRGHQMRIQLRTALREDPHLEASREEIDDRTTGDHNQQNRQEPSQQQPRTASMRGRAGINPANQLRTGQEQGRSAETRRPRTPSNSRKIEAHDAPAPRLGEAARTVPIGDPTRTARTRKNPEGPTRPRSEPRRNRHDLTETADTEDNRDDVPTTRAYQHHPYDQSIAEHRRRLARLDLNRPMRNNRMDAGTDYSTSQEDTDTVERRLTGRSTYAETDLRKMPWRKMRRVLARKDKEYEKAEQLLQERLDQAIEEYEHRGKATLRHREEGDERKYIDEQYMSSDCTDATSIYSTSQEDFEEYEARYAGELLPHQRPDCRLWPRRKFRHAQKQFRKEARAQGRPSKPHYRGSRAAFQPIKTAQAQQFRHEGKYRPNVPQAYRHLFTDRAEYKAGRELSRDLGVQLPGEEVRIPWRRNTQRRGTRNAYFTADEGSPTRKPYIEWEANQGHRGNRPRPRNSRSESTRKVNTKPDEGATTATEYFSADSEAQPEVRLPTNQTERDRGQKKRNNGGTISTKTRQSQKK